MNIDYPVKLVTGILFPSEEMLKWARHELLQCFGKEERCSGSWLFDKTDYYKDISPKLYRCFVSYAGLRSAADLADWKIMSCDIEKLSKQRRNSEVRAVNIDPGYINGARLVLASTKDHSHRIYLRDGINAEVTLRFRDGKWNSFDYTFPDFRSGMYDEFLSTVRKDWLKDEKDLRDNND